MAGIKRIASVHPTPDPVLLQEMSDWMDGFLEENFEPIPAEDPIDFCTWINSTNYPLWRKIQLIDTYNKWDNPLDDKDFHTVKAFIKDESYSKLNYPRGIFSRSDNFKCHFGPFIKAMEKYVYKNKFFIKHVPVCDRASIVTGKQIGRAHV